jgi:dCMP deaminase
MNKWDERFLGLAYHVAEWSKDPSTKVGAVIVRPDKTVVSVGFNGLPRGVGDYAERLSDRETKLALTVHAEENAILFARGAAAGCSMYVSMHPCSKCAAIIIQSGITEVITYDGVPDRWKESAQMARQFMLEAGLRVRLL